MHRDRQILYYEKGHKESHPVPYAKDVVNVLKAVGITKLPKVYAFKPKKYAKVIAKKNWTNLHDYVAEKVKGKFNDAFMQKIAERKFVSNIEGSSRLRLRSWQKQREGIQWSQQDSKALV